MSMQRHTTTTTTTAQPAGRVWIAAALLCLALYSVVEGSVNKPSEEQDFLTALRLLHPHGGGEISSYPASVQERLLHAARPVPQSVADRNLANNNNDDYYANNYYNDDDAAAAAGDDYYAAQDDDAAAAGDDYHNDDDYTVTYSNSNQDLTSSALKYVACKNIHSFSTDVGGLQMHRFVVLRLCPATSCSSYNVVGCSSDYLEYMLPVADYLQIMNDYHFTAFEKYCTTCEACTTFEVETDDAAAAADDDDAYSYDDDANYNGDDDDAAAANNYYYDDNYNQRRVLQTKTGDRSLYNYGYYSNGGGNYGNYGYYNNGGGYYNVGDDENDDYYNDDKYSGSSSQAYPWYIGSSGECIYETVCSNYEAVCQDNTFEANDETYFTCTAHENGGYAAPHCAADGLTIEIGRYSDYACSTFTGETVASLQSTYYDQSCVSCNGPESFALVTDDEIDTTSSTYPLCSALYDQSAKCTQHASSSNTAVADYEDEVRTDVVALGSEGCGLLPVCGVLRYSDQSLRSRSASYLSVSYDTISFFFSPNDSPATKQPTKMPFALISRPWSRTTSTSTVRSIFSVTLIIPTGVRLVSIPTSPERPVRGSSFCSS